MKKRIIIIQMAILFFMIFLTLALLLFQYLNQDTRVSSTILIDEDVYNVNNFESIQDAISYASKRGGGIVYLPPNEYFIEKELQTGEGVELIGAGRNQTIIKVATPSGFLNSEGTGVSFSRLVVLGTIRDCLNSPIFPEDFGAIGDGETDDSDAFQRAVNSGKLGTLELESGGKRYFIGKTIDVDVDKIKLINGNNSYLVLEDDIVGLKLLGGKDTKGAMPINEQNLQLAEEQFMPIVSNLQIYSNTDKYVGTGVQAEGTFGLILKNNHLFNLKTGIHLVGFNRNIMIHNNQIWNMRNYGIHWDHVNLHQQIIEKNHISFTKKNLFFEDSDVHNIHIIGNDLEGGGGEQEGNENSVHFLVTDGSIGDMSQIQIVGNSIEEHLVATSSLIKFENQTDDFSKMQIIEISGNELSGSRSNAIEFWNTRIVAINGNNFYGNRDVNIKVLQRAAGFNITGNTFSGTNDNDSNKGILLLKSGLNVRNFIINANTGDNLHGPPIQMQSKPDGAQTNSSGKLLIDGMNISNNIFTMADNYEGKGEFLVDIGADSLNGFVYTNNQLKTCPSCTNGTRIFANSINHSIINKNIIYNANRNMNKYLLPDSSSSVIVSENE